MGREVVALCFAEIEISRTCFAFNRNRAMTTYLWRGVDAFSIIATGQSVG